MIFHLPTLQEATENFSENNKLGEGGFGSVYKVSYMHEKIASDVIDHSIEDYILFVL